MHAPGFWSRDGILPRLLSPIGCIVAATTARRVARIGWRAPVPVVCCGNVTVGGTGKTILALDLGARLQARGHSVAFLTRGYRGRARGVVRVQDPHDPADFGDEAVLLARLAPTWVGADRAATARAAIASGATMLVMDDGLQNPTLTQDLSIMVVDGAVGFGNGRVLPAGPLREPAAVGAARCDVIVAIGPDGTGATAGLGLPILNAALVPDSAEFSGRRVLAFAGIGRPAKFFATCVQAGAVLAGQVAFPDHHRYRNAELARLRRRAAALDATLVTTAKDAVRLPADFRAGVEILGVALAWADLGALDAVLDRVG